MDLTPLLIVTSSVMTTMFMGGIFAAGWVAARKAHPTHVVQAHAPTPVAPTTPITARIEVADLRDRVRRLEAIAAGVEL